MVVIQFVIKVEGATSPITFADHPACHVTLEARPGRASIIPPGSVLQLPAHQAHERWHG
jgi:hypothetical protein